MSSARTKPVQKKEAARSRLFSCKAKLFDCNFAAGFFDSLLEFFGFFLGNAGLDRLGGADDDFLRFAESETGDFLHGLYDLQLGGFVVGGEFYVEFGLFFFCGSSGGAGSGGDSYGSSGNAVFFFKSFNEILEFKDGKTVDEVEYLGDFFDFFVSSVMLVLFFCDCLLCRGSFFSGSGGFFCGCRGFFCRSAFCLLVDDRLDRISEAVKTGLQRAHKSADKDFLGGSRG